LGKRDQLLIHLVDDNLTEVGRPVRSKTWKQEFTYKKRMFPIETDAAKFADYKGVHHLFININESDGTYRMFEYKKVNLLEPIEIQCPSCGASGEIPLDIAGVPRNMCDFCGDKISYDARNVRDMGKRKTIDTFWGIDSSHILLLLVMGIIAIGAFGGVFYLLGQNTNLQQQLNKYLPSPEEVKNSGKQTPSTPKLLLELYN